MTLPNFFLIGAQKCGTTALYQALRQHPQIYMSPLKEPRFFAFAEQPPAFRGPGDGAFNQTTVTDLTAYQALFEQATTYKAIGEASPIYLSSYQPSQTARRIATVVPQARLIAILRQPSLRAWSAFLHHRRLGMEPLADFRQALAQEAERRRQQWYPGWRYRQNGRYAANLQPYFDHFARQQIKVYLYEEWNNEPRAVLQDIFRFLDVDANFTPDVSQRYNVSWTPHSHPIQRLLQKLARGQEPGEKHSLSVWPRHILKLSENINHSHPSLPHPFYRQLTRTYHNSLRALERLLERDLSAWY